MPTTYELGANPWWYIADVFGEPGAGAKMYTYKAADRTPFPAYQDSGGLVPYPVYPVGITADGSGTFPPIYWEVNGTDAYFIQIYDKNGTFFREIDNFSPGSGGGGSIVTNNVDIENQLINGQFSFFDTVPSPIPAGTTPIAPGGWVIVKNNQTVTDALTFAQTALGDAPPTFPPQNPPYILTYTCPPTPTGESIKDILCIIPDVKSFAGQTITFSFSCRGSVASGFEMVAFQYFGTGGAPSATLTNANAVVFPTASFETRTWTFVPNDLTGPLTRGTNGDDSFQIGVRLPLNGPGTFEFTNFQLTVGSLTYDYIYETELKTRYKVLEELIENALYRTGDTKFTYVPSQAGWLQLVDNETIGSSGSIATHKGNEYFNLYVALWNNTLDTWCPVSLGRGTSALLDWNANKTLRLPLTSGRVVGNVLGAGAYLNAQSAGSLTTTLTSNNIPTFQSEYPGGINTGIEFFLLDQFSSKGGQNTINVVNENKTNTGTASAFVVRTNADIDDVNDPPCTVELVVGETPKIPVNLTQPSAFLYQLIKL